MIKNHNEIFDEWLVLRCQTGDKKAMDLLVRSWHPKLLKQGYWHTRDSEAAKDIAQECWPHIIRGINTIKDPANFRVWVYRIVYRRAVDWIRERKKNRLKEENSKDIKEELTAGYDEGQEDRIKMMRKKLQQLPHDQRIILSMFYLNNQTIREIAKIMSIPVGTVKSRLFHARELLKKNLNKMNYEKL